MEDIRLPRHVIDRLMSEPATRGRESLDRRYQLAQSFHLQIDGARIMFNEFVELIPAQQWHAPERRQALSCSRLSSRELRDELAPIFSRRSKFLRGPQSSEHPRRHLPWSQ